MRKLLGYCCHVASVRLHVAARSMNQNDSTLFSRPHFSAWVDGRGWKPVTLLDVAPRLAAAIEAARDKVQHAQWLAVVVGLGRMAEKDGRDG